MAHHPAHHITLARGDCSITHHGKRTTAGRLRGGGASLIKRSRLSSMPADAHGTAPMATPLRCPGRGAAIRQPRRGTRTHRRRNAPAARAAPSTHPRGGRVRIRMLASGQRAAAHTPSTLARLYVCRAGEERVRSSWEGQPLFVATVVRLYPLVTPFVLAVPSVGGSCPIPAVSVMRSRCTRIRR